jgi:CO/xanthine dehydrogenase Mo-binding subunit
MAPRAAIGNAVFDALNVRVRDLPKSRDHIIAAIETGPDADT